MKISLYFEKCTPFYRAQNSHFLEHCVYKSSTNCLCYSLQRGYLTLILLYNCCSPDTTRLKAIKNVSIGCLI